MKLTCFRYGSTYLKESEALKGGDRNILLPISLLFFLIETEGYKILVDVGCDTMPGFFLKEHRSPVRVLEDIGISRDEITHIILTHAHHDHAQCVHYYKNAEIIMHRNALPFAKQFLGADQKVTLYDTVYNPCNNVLVTYVGGHADGSSIVTVGHGECETVLCGDECYVRESFTEKRLSGAVRDAEIALAFIEKYREHKNTVFFHDDHLVGSIGSCVLLETEE